MKNDEKSEFKREKKQKGDPQTHKDIEKCNRHTPVLYSTV